MRSRRKRGFTLLELTVVLLILIALAGVVLPFTQGTVEQTACQATDATLAAVKEAIMGGASGPGYYQDLGKNFPAYQDGSGKLRYHLHFLFNTSTAVTPKKYLYPSELKEFNPNIPLGWRGPYVQSGGGKLKAPAELDNTFTQTATYPPAANQYVYFDHKDPQFAADVFVLDHYRFRNPIVLQVPDDADSDLDDCSGYPDGSFCARLVSAGPDGELQTQIIDADASERGDDRVLFLRIPDPYPQGNQPCVK